MPPRPMERLTGRVTHERARAGTASEHDAVVLRTDDGERLILQRIGGNPFDDAETRALVGRTVCVEGVRLGDVLRYVSADDA